jgi:hypothetical protein
VCDDYISRRTTLCQSLLSRSASVIVRVHLVSLIDSEKAGLTVCYAEYRPTACFVVLVAVSLLPIVFCFDVFAVMALFHFLPFVEAFFAGRAVVLSMQIGGDGALECISERGFDLRVRRNRKSLLFGLLSRIVGLDMLPFGVLSPCCFLCSQRVRGLEECRL